MAEKKRAGQFVKEGEEFLRSRLPDSPEEIRSMIWLLTEAIFGLSRAQILADADLLLSEEKKATWEEALHRLGKHEPIQYVTGKAYFYEEWYEVNPSVLIPRPETEELVHTIVKDFGDGKKPATIRGLDLGTGSGCIAISLAAHIPNSQLFGLDVSPSALATAEKNEQRLGQKVHWIKQDLLHPPLADLPSGLDFIVSNPPYVAESEKKAMAPNVLSYEPALALFVPDTNPLVFYRAVVSLAVKKLNPGGHLYLEINPRFALETLALCQNKYFRDAQLLADFRHLDRFVKATRTGIPEQT